MNIMHNNTSKFITQLRCNTNKRNIQISANQPA